MVRGPLRRGLFASGCASLQLLELQVSSQSKISVSTFRSRLLCLLFVCPPHTVVEADFSTLQNAARTSGNTQPHRPS